MLDSLSARHRADRIRPRRRWLTIATVSGLLLGTMSFGGAQAEITTLTNGQTISGIIAVNDGRGGKEDCAVSDPSKSRLQVTRVADGATVHTASRSGAGALTSTWNTVGQPLGQYRVRSWAVDGKKSGFLNLGCTTKPEVLLSDLTVALQNKAAVAVSLPEHVVTGESLPVTVSTTVDASGVTNQPLGGRTVKVTVPGVGDKTVVTNDHGNASTSFDLPDLASGALAVTADVADDASFIGEHGSASTILDPRTTGTTYVGATRAQPGSSSTLKAQLVDRTPGSARAGQPIAGEQVALGLGADTDSAATSADGNASRSVRVEGASRTETAEATYAGSTIWGPSADTVTFYVGDAAATPAPVEHGLLGGLTRSVGALLTNVIGNLPSSSTPVAGRSLDTLLLNLKTLLGDVAAGAGRSGDPLDKEVDTLLDGLESDSPLGELVDTARFTWRGVYVKSDGTTRRSEFGATIGIPQPLDVTGDGKPDVLAVVKLAGRGLTPVPSLEIGRLADAPADLPLSLQALLTLPGDTTTYRFGYDTRTSDAPDAFRADILLGDGGAGLEVSSTGDAALAVTGALTPAEAETGTPASGSGDVAQLDGDALDVPDGLTPKEQRFGVSFDKAPTSARLALDLAGGQNFAATFDTDRPTTVGVQLADDSGSDEVFLADATFAKVDGTLAVSFKGAEETGLSASIHGDTGLDEVSLRARTLDAGRTDSDIVLGLLDVPDTIDFTLGGDGAGSLSASGPIGTFGAGYSTGGEIATLDDPAYLRLLTEGDRQSVALRLPGFEGLTLDLRDTVALNLTMAPAPLRALVTQDGLTLDANILDAPHQLGLSLSPDGAVKVEGSDAIDQVTIKAEDATGSLLGATNLDVRLTDIPHLLSVEVGDDGVGFDTGGEPVGLVEIAAHSGDPIAIPGDGDGLVLDQSTDATRLAARISGLREISAQLDSTPDLLLDTVAGHVFTVKLLDGENDVNATIDHLVPGMRLGLVDDGTGALRLDYSASEATNSLAFDLGGLNGSIAGPLPKTLSVCMADDEACLPGVGIDNPALGSVRFAASEYTTLNLVDSAGGLSAENLRLQRLDLTGNLNTDDGGPVYLNTTDFDGSCGFDGCENPIQGGKVTADLGSAKLEFTPGNGFSAVDAVTDLVPTKILGQTTGVKATGGTGIVRCVSATALKVTVEVIGIPITLNLRDAICQVPNRTPRTP
jgi:hypothetical protein